MTAGRKRCAGGGNNLIPVNGDTSGTRRSDTKATFGLTLEPSLRPFVVTQVGFELLQASAIVILHPLLLVLGKHAILNHLGLNGDAGESLKAKPAFAVEIVFGLDPSHRKSRFDTDTPPPWKI